MNLVPWLHRTASRGLRAGLLAGLLAASVASAHPTAAARKRTAAEPLAAQVEYVRGQTTAAPRAAAKQRRRGRKEAASPVEPVPVTTGAQLAEGSRIQVPDDGYLRLRLADGSVVRVLAGSDIDLRRLRRKADGSFESMIDVRRGKVESEVAPQRPGRVFEIRAPGAVASVRGTRFVVSVDENGRMGTAVTEGKVKLLPRAKARRGATVTAGEGMVLGADGRLGALRELPPVPDLSAWPAEHHDANLLALSLPADNPGYDVRIARDEELREVVRDGRFTDGQIRFTGLPDGSYTIGVRRIDADGIAGPESKHRLRIHAHPVPPLYQSPIPGTRLLGDAIQLACSQTVRTDWVHIQVSESPDFSRLLIDEPRLALCQLGLPELPEGDYHWRAASVSSDAQGGIAHGPFAAAQQFSVVKAPPPPSFQVSDGEDGPTLNWDAAPGQVFRAQLAHDEAFTRIVADIVLDRPAWKLPALARGSYFVRLQTRDAGGPMGPFSPPRRVYIGGVVQTSTGTSLTTSDGEPVNRR